MILCVNNNGAFHQPTIPSSKRRISRHFYSSQNKRKKCERVVSRRLRPPPPPPHLWSRLLLRLVVYVFVKSTFSRQKKTKNKNENSTRKLGKLCVFPRNPKTTTPLLYKREISASETWKAGNTAWETEWIKRWMRRRTNYSLK